MEFAKAPFSSLELRFLAHALNLSLLCNFFVLLLEDEAEVVDELPLPPPDSEAEEALLEAVEAKYKAE